MLQRWKPHPFLRSKSSIEVIRHGYSFSMLKINSLILVLVSIGPLIASQGKIPFPSIPSTFLLRPVVVNLERGGKAEILVEVVASFGGESKFEISRPPKYGTIDAGQRVSSSIRRFQYKNNPSSYSAEDEFEFRIKAPNHAWSTYTAKIFIKNSAPTITVTPEKLNFGNIAVGTTKQSSFLLSNSFGAPISGRLQVRDPWSIAGEDFISLGQGESCTVSILFSPSNAQQYTAICKIDPENISFPFIPLNGKGVAPFLLSSTSAIVTPDHTEAIFKVANNIETPITVTCSGDSDLDYADPLTIPPSAVAELKVSSPRIKLKEDEICVFHAHINSDHYSQKIDITVMGPKGKIVINVPEEDKPLRAMPGEPISIDGTLGNQSQSVHSIHLKLQNPSDPKRPPTVESIQVAGGKEVPFSITWRSAESVPKVLSLNIFDDQKQLAQFSWNVLVKENERRNQSNSTTSGPRTVDETKDKVAVRLATTEERDKLVIYQAPCFRDTLLGRKLVLRWLYYGSENPGFQIRQHIKNNSLSNRTGEDQIEWVTLGTLANCIKKGADGKWEAVIPMPHPGFHDYMITTDFPGEKLAASQSIHISWGTFLWPYLRILLLVSVITIVVKVIRRRA